MEILNRATILCFVGSVSRTASYAMKEYPGTRPGYQFTLCQGTLGLRGLSKSHVAAKLKVVLVPKKWSSLADRVTLVPIELEISLAFGSLLVGHAQCPITLVVLRLKSHIQVDF